MGEVLGIGMTHYPGLIGPPERYANQLRSIISSHLVPDEMKQPSSWPQPMQDEYANEIERAYEHRDRHREAFKRVRAAIDDFRPDAVIVFGDDQYEDYKEDLIPPFAVMCRDSFPTSPFRNSDNIWGATAETVIDYPGAGKVAREIANSLINKDFPIPYSYKPHHYTRGLGHAFSGGLVFLDFDNDNPWEYPLIPIQVNCYGRSVIKNRGSMGHLRNTLAESEKDDYLDQNGPDGPTARTCFRLGELLREIIEERPERFAVIASSSWSHAFLTEKNHWLWPDLDFDREHVEQLRRGDQHEWAKITNDQIYDSGDQEFRNWICLAGVVPDRTPSYVEYLENYIFNSPKCFTILGPETSTK